MSLKIYPNSTNYTCQVIALPTKQAIPGLDNLVGVNVQGNTCLIGKDSSEDELYLFFPAECQLSQEFLMQNNLYRHSELNSDKTQKGFFEDNGRVKAIKFKGIISSGFVIPVKSLEPLIKDPSYLKIGDEFNELEDWEICKKYVVRTRGEGTSFGKSVRILDEVIDSRNAPEHLDTAHLFKNLHKIDITDQIIVTYKLHGTSARYYNTLVNRKLNWFEKLLQRVGIKIQTEVYDYVAASRKVIKSIGFEQLPDKNHYYSEDLWSKVGKEFFDGKLYKGEAVYCEIIGQTYDGQAIQKGYSYGLTKPEVYIYRIANINPQGIEVDLPHDQMEQRAEQLGLKCCPVFFKGPLHGFIEKHSIIGYIKDDREWKDNSLNHIFYEVLLEKPSILDPSVVEEGFCIRVDKYPKPEIFKIKSKQFLLHEGNLADKEEVSIEDEQS